MSLFGENPTAPLLEKDLFPRGNPSSFPKPRNRRFNRRLAKVQFQKPKPKTKSKGRWKTVEDNRLESEFPEETEEREEKENQASAAYWETVLAERFSSTTDEEAVAMAQQGNAIAEEYLLTKYKNFVRSKARSYFLIGADHEDIVQEGMIGLFKAIRDYQPERLSSFRAFAELCITRQIITAIKTATRQKHMPLNSYVSLNRPIYDEESERTLMDVIVEHHAQNPEELILGKENMLSLREKAEEVLSSLEKEVLDLYLDGKSYQEIGAKLNRHVKSIDNALQRVKRKLEKYLEEERKAEEE